MSFISVFNPSRRKTPKKDGNQKVVAAGRYKGVLLYLASHREGDFNGAYKNYLATGHGPMESVNTAVLAGTKSFDEWEKEIAGFLAAHNKTS